MDQDNFLQPTQNGRVYSQELWKTVLENYNTQIGGVTKKPLFSLKFKHRRIRNKIRNTWIWTKREIEQLIYNTKSIIKELLDKNTIENIEKKTLRKYHKKIKRKNFDDLWKNGNIYDSHSLTMSHIFGVNQILLPVIRRVYPSLVAQEMISVQPMLSPIALKKYSPDFKNVIEPIDIEETTLEA